MKNILFCAFICIYLSNFIIKTYFWCCFYWYNSLTAKLARWSSIFIIFRDGNWSKEVRNEKLKFHLLSLICINPHFYISIVFSEFYWDWKAKELKFFIEINAMSSFREIIWQFLKLILLLKLLTCLKPNDFL